MSCCLVCSSRFNLKLILFGEYCLSTAHHLIVIAGILMIALRLTLVVLGFTRIPLVKVFLGL